MGGDQSGGGWDHRRGGEGGGGSEWRGMETKESLLVSCNRLSDGPAADDTGQRPALLLLLLVVPLYSSLLGEWLKSRERAEWLNASIACKDFNFY